jgi:hypothetical protein
VKDTKEKIIALLLLVTLATSTVAALSEPDSFSVDYTFEAVERDGQWLIRDTLVQGPPGEPLVPYRPAQILLPQGSTVSEVSIICSDPIIQEGFDIPCGQLPCPFSEAETAQKVEKNVETYSSSDWYLGKVYDVVTTESFRGYDILYVNLFPVDYQLSTGTVKFYKKLIVEVAVEPGPPNNMCRDSSEDRAAISGFAENVGALQTYTQCVDEYAPSLPGGPYEYVIITNNILEPVFQQLRNHKANYVSGAKIVTLDWIYSNFSGQNNPERIRKFIRAAYFSWDTSYCLLGGDVFVVPYRGFYVKIETQEGTYIDADMAADMYYGCLDGTFNADGDNKWGEPGDGVDWLEEVFIGRAPVFTVSEAERFVNKVISYEMASREKVCQYHASYVKHNNEPDARQVAWDCEYWTPSDYTKKELFETEGRITKSLWRSAWTGSYGGSPYYPPVMFQHMGHGAARLYYINYEVGGGEVAWSTLDCPSLTNSNFWPVHTSVACHSGEFEANDCLAEAYVKDDCGAIAALMNDNYGWYDTNDASKYSGEFVENQFRALFSDGKEHLGELLNQSKCYLISPAQHDNVYRWCYYEINLIGDPETPILTRRTAVPENSVTITNPPNGADSYGTVRITTNVSGDIIDTVEFWINGVLTYTDTAYPYKYYWSTSSYPEDQEATILVKGYDGPQFVDEDSTTVMVNNYFIVITNPSIGEIVSGKVTVTTDTHGVDMVKFYIDGEHTFTDTSPPFQYKWQTKNYSDTEHIVMAKGYKSGALKDTDEISCFVDNSWPCSGTTLICLLVLFGSAGMYRRR